MRLVSTMIALGVGLGLAGCNDKMHLHPPDSARDAYQPPWWTPKPGDARNWDIQVTAPFDFSASRAMYIVDLWAVATATTIDYGDGSPITVPAGPQAGKIAELKARGGKVICRVGTAAIRLTDPDASKYPGFAATPPDDPDPPAAGSVIGWSTDDPMERYLDIRAASLPRWQSRLWKRIDLAKQLGCDGIEHDWIDAITGNQSGFTLVPDDQMAFGNEVASQDHMRELSAGFQNGTTNPLIEGFATKFDWLILERCGEYGDCDLGRAFLNAMKPIFALDYQTDSDGMPLTTGAVCGGQAAVMVDGIVKDSALSSAFRHQCMP